MKSQSYMTRALQAKDPRFANILGRLGYETKEPSTDEPVPVSMDLLKADLIRIAEAEGVEIETDDNKADLVRKIEAARKG